MCFHGSSKPAPRPMFTPTIAPSTVPANSVNAVRPTLAEHRSQIEQSMRIFVGHPNVDEVNNYLFGQTLWDMYAKYNRQHGRPDATESSYDFLRRDKKAAEGAFFDMETMRNIVLHQVGYHKLLENFTHLGNIVLELRKEVEELTYKISQLKAKPKKTTKKRVVKRKTR